TALLLDFFGRPGCHARWNAAIDSAQNMHDFPLLAFRGMDGRKDEVVIITRCAVGTVARRFGRIERHLCQKSFARGVRRRDLLELGEVSLPCHYIIVEAIELRLVPTSNELELGGPVRFRRPDGIEDG